MNETKVIHPTGWEAGREVDPAEVIKALAMEMLSHRADLRELTAKRARNQEEREAILQEAEDLERYAIAAFSVAYQMQRERWAAGSMGGFLELAAKHKIPLPEWMQA